MLFDGNIRYASELQKQCCSYIKENDNRLRGFLANYMDPSAHDNNALKLFFLNDNHYAPLFENSVVNENNISNGNYILWSAIHSQE